MNWRKIPHPSYGNWGGAYNTCNKDVCPLPIDGMDAAFEIHDNDLGLAKTKEDLRMADARLYRHLKELKKSDLVHPIYGILYKLGAQLVFGISSGAIKVTPWGKGIKFTKKF